MSSFIRCEKADGIATVTIDRPQQHNAIDYGMWLALRETARQLSADSAVKVVIVTGGGDRAFSSGADIKDFPAHRSSSSLAGEYADAFEGALDAFEAMPKPVVSMIRGICVGGGCELAMATDLRIAADDATLGVPIAKIGVLAGYKEMRRLVQLVGRGNAMALLLAAKTIDAAEALRIGLVTDVVPVARLAEYTYALAERMATYAPLSQSGHKRILQTVLSNPSLHGLTPEEEAFPLSIFDTEDGMEGYRAFVEKRPPRFKGR